MWFSGVGDSFFGIHWDLFFYVGGMDLDAQGGPFIYQIVQGALGATLMHMSDCNLEHGERIGTWRTKTILKKSDKTNFNRDWKTRIPGSSGYARHPARGATGPSEAQPILDTCAVCLEQKEESATANDTGMLSSSGWVRCHDSASLILLIPKIDVQPRNLFFVGCTPHFGAIVII